MLKFSTKFPYLDQIEKGSADVRKVNVTLQENNRIEGYFIKFRIKLNETTSNFTYTNKYDIFVYYSDIKIYETECFPTKIIIEEPW